MANQVDYRDPTPNNFPQDYDPAKADPRVKLRSDSIKHKQKGIDTREAMYQALEIGSVTANEANAIAKDTQNRFNDQINNKVDPNEVVDARRPFGGVAYDKLGLRLDDMNKQTDRASSNQVFNRLDLKRSARFVDVNYLQGNCYTGQGRWVRATNNNDGITTLIETDIDGVVIKSKQVELGHANWIDYDNKNGLLYVSELYSLDSTGKISPNKIVDVLDYATLDFVKKIDLTSLINDVNAGIMSYSHDNVTGEVYVCTESGNNGVKLYLYDEQDNKLTDIPIPARGYEQTPMNQGVCAYNGYLYFIKFEPSAIFKFDKSGKLHGVYNVDYLAQDSYFVGEIEQISPMFDKDEGEAFLLGAVHRLNTYDSRFIHQSFHVNFSSGIPVIDKMTSGMPLKETKYIEVDANTDVVNGDGTSAKPFKDISEALELTNNMMYQNMFINVKSGNYPIITFYNPSAFVIIKGIEDNVVIGGLRGRGINVRLVNVQLKIDNSAQNEDISVESSTIDLDTVKCLTTTGNNLYCESSEIKINNCTFSAPIPISLNKVSTLKCNPFVMPAFASNGPNLIVPGQYQITTSVTTIKRVGQTNGITLNAAEKEMLKSSPYFTVQLLFQGNLYFIKGALVDGSGAISNVVGGALNNMTTSGAFTNAEIQVNVDVNLGKVWIDHVSITNILINTATKNITGDSSNVGVSEDLADIGIVRLWGGY